MSYIDEMQVTPDNAATPHRCNEFHIWAVVGDYRKDAPVFLIKSHSLRKSFDAVFSNTMIIRRKVKRGIFK
jgi:hypothetical protein